MSHINKGNCSEKEVQEFLGIGETVTAYAKDQDNPRSIGYDHWSNIKHPETGENLAAVKGYCNPQNTYQCYYAEYRDANGNSYHYLDNTNNPLARKEDRKTIKEQQFEDRQELEKNMNQQNEAKANEHSNEQSNSINKGESNSEDNNQSMKL